MMTLLTQGHEIIPTISKSFNLLLCLTCKKRLNMVNLLSGNNFSFL